MKKKNKFSVENRIKDLKHSIRIWMGMLSIEELMLNQDLVELFKSIEQRIQRLEQDYV